MSPTKRLVPKQELYALSPVLATYSASFTQSCQRSTYSGACVSPSTATSRPCSSATCAQSRTSAAPCGFRPSTSGNTRCTQASSPASQVSAPRSVPGGGLFPQAGPSAVSASTAPT